MDPKGNWAGRWKIEVEERSFKSALRYSSLRVLMALRAKLGLHACWFDLVAAFLQGTLLDDETIHAAGPCP